MAGDDDPSPQVPGAPAFSRYEIQARVGEGATAVIYRARDRSLHRVLALKVLKETIGYTDIGRQRFRREAQATAGLSHPNLVTAYSASKRCGISPPPARSTSARSRISAKRSGSSRATRSR